MDSFEEMFREEMATKEYQIIQEIWMDSTLTDNEKIEKIHSLPREILKVGLVPLYHLLKQNKII